MAQNYPPAGYMSVASQVQGIEVYQPLPKPTEKVEAVTTFTCPRCGAATSYNISQSALACAHCGYVDESQVKQVGTRAAENEFTVETMQDAAHGWGEARTELVCQNCGAHATVDVNNLTHTCAFCGSNKVIQQAAAQDALRPKFLAPFTVAIQDCQKLAQTWLGSSWMTPKSLAQAVTVQNFTALYLPYWTFDAITHANWKAEVGHTESERYYDHGDKTWKTRMKTVWRWESGRVNLTVDDLLVPGTSRLSALHLGKIGDFDLHKLVVYEPRLLAGMQAHSYDLGLDPAWEQARQVMREKTRDACRNQASTSQIRNFSMNLDFSDEVWRYVLLPVYLAAYTYEGKTYQVLVNGQTGQISGQRPVDWNKVWLAIALALAPGLLVSLVGLVALPLFGAGVPIGGIGFVLLIIGIIIAVTFGMQASKMGEA